MKSAAVIAARLEAERFLRKVAEYEETKEFERGYSIGGCKQSAAVKRASMDLTRVLADLRR